MYSQLKVHVPERYHKKVKAAVTKDHPLSIKIDLTQDGEQVILLTPGQLLKITRAVNAGKKVLTLCMSRKQARANVKFECVILIHVNETRYKSVTNFVRWINNRTARWFSGKSGDWERFISWETWLRYRSH